MGMEGVPTALMKVVLFTYSLLVNRKGEETKKKKYKFIKDEGRRGKEYV